MGCTASVESYPASSHYKKSFSSSIGGLSSNTDYQNPAVRNFGYPPPTPPQTKKKDVFNIEDVTDLDKHATCVPTAVLCSSYKDLALHLFGALSTDLLRVRAIFRWMTMLDLDELEKSLTDLPEPGTPCDYLLKIKWKMANFAHLFAQVARAGGLACVVVTGINKSAAYQLGVPINREAMAAQWNAVYVDGEWRLLDAFWASTVLVGKKSRDWALIDEDGFGVEGSTEDEDEGETVHAVNEFFFLTDPDQLIWTHLPDDRLWQLLPNPITEVDFESNVYIRERFFDLNMSLLPESDRKYFIRTKEGKAVVVLGLDRSKALHSQFRYLLFRNRDSGEVSNVPFERFVFFEKSEHSITYTITFPVEGLFKMEIFGQNPKEHESLDLVCSYLIECKDPRSVQPLPVCPDIGWGPGLEAADKGLEALTHKTGIIETADGRVEIRFRMKDRLDVAHSLKHNQLEAWLLKRFAVVRQEDDQLVIDARLPTSGEFALELYARGAGASGQLDNVCNYLIKCSNPNVVPAPFPKVHEGVLGRNANCDGLNVRAVSHLCDVIDTTEEHLTVVFENESADVELMCELHQDAISSEIMSKTVLRTVDDRCTTFNIGLPKEGEYALNVYARRKDNPDRIYHVHSYLVRSKQMKRFQTEKPKKPEQVLPIVTNKSELSIRVPHARGELVGEFRKEHSKEEPGRGSLLVEKAGSNSVLKLKVPEDGEYKLTVYSHHGNKGLQHVSTYMIQKDSTITETTQPVFERDTSAEEEANRREKALASKHKSARDQLKAAMSSQDKELLKEAIDHFEMLGTPETKSELTKAKQLLQYLRVSEELTTAMTDRNLKKLDRIVPIIERTEFKGKLHLQLAMAKRILEQLKRIEKLRHAIMKLDQRTIAELKSYSTPPDIVNKVMTVTFMLLGEKEKHLKQWKALVVQIGKTGRASLKRRVSQFNVEALPISVAARGREILSRITLDEVRTVSNGAATFYVWSVGMIEECESRFLLRGGDMSAVHTRPR